MDITVVIPVDGRFGYLARALETILRQDSLTRSLRAEIIVIDNSRDESKRSATRSVCRTAATKLADDRAALRYLAARHPSPNHRNCGFAKNVGIRHASAPVVMFSDADVLHVTETLAQHVRYHKEIPNLVMHGFCRNCPADVPLTRKTLMEAAEDPSQAVRMHSSKAWVGGPCFSVKRAHLLEIGGIEESFTRWGYEDYDLVRRLRLAGARIHCDDEIVTLHQNHPVAGTTGYMMKAYAGIRQLLSVRVANRNRSWGQTAAEPELVAP